MIGNLYAGKLMFDIHHKVAYNLADQDFSRVLTLHQDFKRKDLMKEGNRPYSITYRIAYALFNTYHSDLFLRKEYIEIPIIFKEFAKVMTPDPIKIPRIGGVDIIIKDHQVLDRTLSSRTEFSSRMSFSEDRCTGYKEKEKELIKLFTPQEIRISEEEIKNLKEALQEIKSLDISEESELSLENIKRLIQRNFSENPLEWWDMNKIETTLKVKEECKYEYVQYKPIQMNMEDKKDMQGIIKEHINLRLIELGVSTYSSPGFLVRNHGEIKRGKPMLVINYQGILIDETGVELHDHIVEKIHNFPDMLKDKKHLQSFLGVVNFAEGIASGMSHELRGHDPKHALRVQGSTPIAPESSTDCTKPSPDSGEMATIGSHAVQIPDDLSQLDTFGVKEGKISLRSITGSSKANINELIS
ncbi:UNVERIFIED_CONTAM: movement protein [Sesamum radiatum]|uniref:Movement protein n=1 Tax=Sesamum radiatum TaxID=300843 RepID=A0AAW2PZT6_SESRA